MGLLITLREKVLLFMNKLEIKLSNFKNALERLKEAVDEYKKENASDVIRDGVIQRFEFTYELSWKTTKEYLESIGLIDINSPKLVFKEAFAQRLIEDETIWLLMLNDRNKTSHIYNEKMANEIAERIVNSYIEVFETLIAKLEF